MQNIGNKMYELIKELFPINRSLSGEGVRKTLKILQRENPELNIYEIKSGTEVFDWTVPKEWNCKEAYIITPDGKKICDYNKNNLHLVQYSIPFEGEVDLDELQKHLYSLPKLSDAIPYVTSYYKERWGFCISENERKKLKPGKYRVVIRSELKDGVLNYADIVIPGKSDKEIMFSTYICHPSMANNELSGPVLATFLAKYVKNLDNHYTYRFIFAPETIGSLIYLSKHLNHLKKKVIAGFILTCVGDERAYSYMPSRYGNTLADKAALNILEYDIKDYKKYSFLQRGSDERQYCAPGVDLPVCSVMRSKYAEYPEYHTSLDNLELVTPKGLEDSFNIYKKIIDVLENNFYYKVTVLGEPQLGKRGLYPDACTPDTDYDLAFLYRNFLAYADGKNDLIDIANIIGVNADRLTNIAKLFEKHNLIKVCYN
jgi:aminopeptidase-like protein